MKKTKYRWLKLLSIIIASIIALIIIIPILATAIISSPKMKPSINKICTSFVPEGKIEMDTISLSIFEEFPYLSLKLSNGVITSNAFDNDSLNILYGGVAPDDAHNLLSFDQLVVSVNIPQLIFGKIDVRRIRLVGPEIYAYISPWGRPNWDIFASDTTSTDEAVDEESVPIDLNVRRISLRNLHLIYDDSQNMNSFEAGIGRFSVRGRLGLDMEKLAIDRVRLTKSDFVLYMEESGSLAEVHIDSLRISSVEEDLYDIAFASSSNLMMESKVYTEHFPINIKGKVGVDITDPSNFLFDSTYISVAESPILINGRASIMEDAIFTNLTCDIDRLALGKVLPYLNTQAFPELKGMTTNLSLSLKAEAMGRYEMESGRLPAIKADFKIHKGKLHYPGIAVDVDRLAFDSFLNYDPYNVDSTSILIKKMDIDATGLKLDAKGSGVNILKDPNMDLSIVGSADLTTLSRIFLKDMGITTTGDMSIDMKGKFKLSDLSLTNVGNTRIRGKFKSDNLLLDMPNDTIHALMRGVSIVFGSVENTRDTLVEQGLQTLMVSFRADSADVNYKDQMMINLSKARIAAKSAADGFSGDTSKVHPLLGKVDAERLRITTSDSIRIRGRQIKASATLLPDKDSASVPVITVKTESRNLSYRDAQSWYSIRNSTINFQGTFASTANARRRNDPAAIVRREHRLDSLQRLYPSIQRDSLMAYSRRMNPADAMGDEGNIDMSVGKSIEDILNKWNVNCSIKAKSGRITTPYFPLRNRLGNTDLSFTTNEIKFNDTHLRSGQTSLTLTGRIWGIRRALTRKGKLRADLQIDSDTLNVNELLRAADAASKYMEAEASFKDSLAAIQDEEEIQKALAQNVDTLSPTPLLIVPGNIDMKIGLHVKYGEYGTIILDDISGNLLAKDRCLQIKDFNAITEAGDLALTALYATKSKDDLNTGFDLEMKNMQVEKLIDLIPSVDTLLPMLRSFKGRISCQLAATADIDTSMNILLPSLNGVARIKGRDLVLLDGQTFAEIAKMLKFKNRETNIIDSISVEMLVADNKIEMFPFIMQMDRYQAAVSGVQNLDMSFKYHISVIKSPLPMRLGINIFGDNFDKMKFRLGKPKYKTANIPSYTQIIDSSRINLIHSINDIFKKGIDVKTISDVKIAPKEDSVMKSIELPELEALSAEDSLALRKEGIIPKPSAKGIPSNNTPVMEPTSEALVPPKGDLWLENPRRVLSFGS